MISTDDIVKHLMKLPIAMHVLVICGNNRILYRRMQRIKPKNGARLSIHRYVNNVEEFMAVSDLIITKPGGLTVTESLNFGLPMLIVSPIPGQESMNTEFLLKHNAAVKASNARDAARKAGDLLTDHTSLRRMREAGMVIAKKTAAFDIAERIVNWEH